MKNLKPSLATSCNFALATILILLGSALAISAQTESVLFKFHNSTSGIEPLVVITDNAGNLYGTTASGGSNNPSCSNLGCGTVFQLTQSQQTGKWSDTLLYSFSGDLDGGGPMPSLVMDSAGNLYGGTVQGGSHTFGVIFKLSPPAVQGDPWTETVLYNFVSLDENSPSGLILDPHGNLYGESPGGFNTGDVFELSPPSTTGGAWSYNILYSFPSAGSNGAQPGGGLALDSTGNLYGSTFSGGIHQRGCGGNSGEGLIFKLAKPATLGQAWSLHVLYRFTLANGDGGGPNGVFLRAGKLYGTTSAGGDNQGCTLGDGTVFEVSPPAAPGSPWTETPIFTFNRTNGAFPMAGVVFDAKGNLYSTTSLTEAYGVNGEVFELTPPAVQGGAWTQTVLHSFTGLADGGQTYSTVALGKQGTVVYGTTLNGGNAQGGGYGVVFGIRP